MTSQKNGPKNSQRTAAILVIGNEVLSGRTADKNIHMIAGKLFDKGVALKEVRVIADDEQAIVKAVNNLRNTYDYVFTTGGIGPTHDDITARSVAKAFMVKHQRNAEAEAILRAYYKPEDLTEARLTMADTPVDVTLIPNPVSAAPGFIKDNVYVMAGVPIICQAMMDGVLPTLDGSPPLATYTLSTDGPEGHIAALLNDVVAAHPDVDIGSYPAYRQGAPFVSLVFKAVEESSVTAAVDATRTALLDVGFDILSEGKGWGG